MPAASRVLPLPLPLKSSSHSPHLSLSHPQWQAGGSGGLRNTGCGWLAERQPWPVCGRQPWLLLPWPKHCLLEGHAGGQAGAWGRGKASGGRLGALLLSPLHSCHPSSSMPAPATLSSPLFQMVFLHIWGIWLAVLIIWVTQGEAFKKWGRLVFLHFRLDDVLGGVDVSDQCFAHFLHACMPVTLSVSDVDLSVSKQKACIKQAPLFACILHRQVCELVVVFWWSLKKSAAL